MIRCKGGESESTQMQTFADCLWYAGHVLTGVAIVVNHYNFAAGVVVVFVGQSITMLSRPIGRYRRQKACDENDL